MGLFDPKFPAGAKPAQASRQPSRREKREMKEAETAMRRQAIYEQHLERLGRRTGYATQVAPDACHCRRRCHC